MSKYDNKITVGVIITLILQGAGAIWFFAKLDARVEGTEKTLEDRGRNGITYYDRLKQTDERVVRVEIRQDNFEEIFKTSLKKIDDNMQRIADGMNVKIVN